VEERPSRQADISKGIQKFVTFYGNQIFITMFTVAASHFYYNYPCEMNQVNDIPCNF